MHIESTGPDLPRHLIQADRLAPDILVDLALVAAPGDQNSADEDAAPVALIRNEGADGDPELGRMMKAAEAAYKFAEKEFLTNLPPGVDASIRGGFVAYTAIETLDKWQAGKIEPIDALLTLGKSGADIGIILNSLNLAQINPLWASGVSTACTVLLLIREGRKGDATTERIARCTFDSSDLPKLPNGLLDQSAYMSLGLGAAALGTRRPVPLPGFAVRPGPALAAGLGEPIEEILMRAAKRGIALGSSGQPITPAADT